MYLCRMCLFVCLLCTGSWSLCAQNPPNTVLKQAQQENKYVYLFLYKTQCPKTLAAEQEFDQAMALLGGKAYPLKVQASAPEMQGLLKDLGLKRAPAPLALVIAPNGAIMGSFVHTFNASQLVSAYASVGAAHCMKALQDRKLVLLCVQNSNSTACQTAKKGVEEFASDPRFSNATVVVTIDPANSEDQAFLQQLGVESSEIATTVMITPPGEVVGRYKGVTHKEQFISDLQKASSCCEGGCCPGGCCSK